MKIYQSPDAAVYLCPVPSAPTRREAEQAAVQSLMAEAFPDGLTRLSHLPSGAPVLEGQRITPCCHLAPRSVSLSHATQYAVLAIGFRSEVGIDIERQRDQLARVAHKFLSPDEASQYSTPDLRLRAWTATEALYKAAVAPGLSLRDGIRLPAPDFAQPATAASRPFRLISIPAPANHAITLAIAISSTNQ